MEKISSVFDKNSLCLPLNSRSILSIQCQSKNKFIKQTPPYNPKTIPETFLIRSIPFSKLTPPTRNRLHNYDKIQPKTRNPATNPKQQKSCKTQYALTRCERLFRLTFDSKKMAGYHLPICYSFSSIWVKCMM